MSDIFGGGNPPSYDEFDKSLNGLPTRLIQNYKPDRYQARRAALQPQPAQKSQEKSFGAAGLLPLLGSPLAIGAAPLVAPAAAAYGIGKLVAPKQTDAVIDWIKSKLAKPQAIGSAYLTGMGESIPGSRFIEKKLPQKWQETIAQIKAQHPGAASAGRLAGTVGTMAIPGANVLKGATTLGKIGAAAGNAAINMAPFSAGAGLNEMADTGDVGQAAKKALAAEALGVGFGTALGGAGLFFSKIAKSAHPALNEIDAASYGLTGQDIAKPGLEFAKKMGLKPQGYQAATGDTQLDKIMTLLREQGGRSKAGIEKAAKWVRDQYDSVNRVFQGSGAKLTDKSPDILASPIVQTMKGKFDPGAVDSTIQSLVTEADRRISSGPKGWTDARDFLNKQMQRGIQIGQKAEGGTLEEVTAKANMGEMLQDSAAVVKAHMNELTGNVLKQAGTAGQSVPDLESLDQIYSAYPSLQRTLARRAGKPMASMAGGSETTAGLGSLAGIAGMVGGPAAAGVAKVAGATALAPLMKRAVGYGTNQIMGRSAAAIDKALQTLSKSKSMNLPGLTARTLGEATEATPQAMQALTGQPPQEPQQTQASIQQAEATVPPEGQEQAKQQVNTAWADQIKSRLDEMYDTYLGPYQDMISRDEFMTAMDEMTNHFDPHLTAGAVFKEPGQATAYLKSYDTALKLQGVNLEQALSTGNVLGVNPLQHPLAGGLTGLVTGRTQESSLALDSLKNAIVQHVTGYGEQPTPAQIKQISADIDGIAGLRVSPATKKQVLREHLKNYGIDYNQLEKYGLVQDVVKPPEGQAV